jgi:quinol monooxygenase YgiN
MIHVIATIQTAPGRREEVLAEFRDLVPLVRAEAGCIEYDAAVDMQTAFDRQQPVRNDVVTVLEKWESVAALRDHLAAAHMMRFREKVKELVVGLELRVLEPAG